MDKHKTSLFYKTREMIKLLNIHLNHFPRHEKYALCQEIRQRAYGIYGLLIECRKKYHNKTSITKLDIEHEQLRMMVNLAFELGYYHYKDAKKNKDDVEALRRYTAISRMIDEIGAMIGGWIKNLNNEKRVDA